MTDLPLPRRMALSLPLATAGVSLLGYTLAGVRRAGAAVNAGSLVTTQGDKLRSLTAALVRAPRTRSFTSVPMILDNPSQWDRVALNLLLSYDGGPKQVWDNTDLYSPWLNLMRNSMNAQIWSFKHPDFLAISATHGSAHLALYDDYIWGKYLTAFTGGKDKSNIWIVTPPAGHADPEDFEDPRGAFSPADNSITVLQRRGAVFCGCHNEVWELTGGLLEKGINPDKLSHPALAAELTNHLIPGVVLTPGIVGTLPQFQLAGFQYAK